MKYSVISCDSNIDYYSLIPLVAHSWHKLGYIPIVIMVNVPRETMHKIVRYCPIQCVFRSIPSVEGVKDSTVAQFARLMIAGSMKDEDTLVTGDGDMIVMQDIFTSEADITSYGFDLTGKSEIPICYVKADTEKWCELMDIDRNKTLYENICLRLPTKAYSDVWEDYWSVDQQYITSRARSYGFYRIKFIDRGFAGPISANRWDRYSWHIVPENIIDVHCIRGMGNWDKIVQMAEYLFPGEVGWLTDFKNEIDKL